MLQVGDFPFESQILPASHPTWKVTMELGRIVNNIDTTTDSEPLLFPSGEDGCKTGSATQAPASSITRTSQARPHICTRFICG